MALVSISLLHQLHNVILNELELIQFRIKHLDFHQFILDSLNGN